jgi:hypothetical protein
MSEPAKLTDRQQHPRHSTQCSGKFYADDREVDCEILNISVGGAKVRLAEPVETDSEVRVRIDRVGEFAGRVAWRDGTTLGIEFHDELSELARIIEELLGGDVSDDQQRDEARSSVLWSGQLLTAGQVVNCRVLNISAKGAQLRAQKPFECGLEVILSIDRYGEFAGKLVWQDGANLGIQFHETPEKIAGVLGDALPSIRKPGA